MIALVATMQSPRTLSAAAVTEGLSFSLSLQGLWYGVPPPAHLNANHKYNRSRPIGAAPAISCHILPSVPYRFSPLLSMTVLYQWKESFTVRSSVL